MIDQPVLLGNNMLLVMKEWGVDVGINPSRPFNDNDCN